MCDEAYRGIQIGPLREGGSQLRIPMRFPEGIRNFAPQDNIRISDRVDIVRAAASSSPDLPGGARYVAADRSETATSG